MTREQYDKLQEFEQDLRYALRMNFMSIGNGRFKELMNIYKEMYGVGLTLRQSSCSTCRLNAIKRIANDYNEFQQRLAEEEKKTREEEAIDLELEEDKPKKKAGRPRKIDLDAE